MKGYIISVAVSTVISALVTMIAPEKWSKYVEIVTGLVVTVCIAQPVIILMQADVFEGFTYNAALTETEGEEVLYKEIKTVLEERISSDVKERLESEFGKNCIAQAEVAITSDGEVKGVKQITVYGEKIDAVAVGRLRDIYGAEEVRYAGPEKTLKKSE